MDWHRLFGLFLTDFFTDSPFVVELEKDLSLHQQLLDVVIIRKKQGSLSVQLPDGLDNLANHNLLTFKSHHEALDDWALKELTGHYVNYRKQVSPPRQSLLPEAEFRLYAVCSRYPHNLANTVALEPVQQGVYDCRRGTDLIRVVVAQELPEAKHNAALFLFSASDKQVAYGALNYGRREKTTSSLLDQLLEGYEHEGVVMPYTMDDFLREYRKNFFKRMGAEERQELLKLLPAKELLRNCDLEELEKYVEERRKASRSATTRKKSGPTRKK